MKPRIHWNALSFFSLFLFLFAFCASSTVAWAARATTPTFSPVAGTYTSTQTVTISDTTSGAKIYYTTNGSTPTTSSTLYSAPITVSVTQTLKALATATGFTNSTVGSAAYTIKVATPTFSPAAGTYTSTQTVTISVSDGTSGAIIYYTTNGTTPTTSSTRYTAAITVSVSQMLEAIATASGYAQSAVGSATYTINLPAAATPTFSPVAGTYSSAQTVTISDGTSGATIYYTTNGTTPTTSSAVYNSPIVVSSSETLEAIATVSGYSKSAVGSAAYTIGSSGAPSNGLYMIINLASGLVLDGGGPGTTKATWVVQDTKTGASNQVWSITNQGGGDYQIIGIGSDLSLDDYADATANGTEIDVYTINNSSGQKWAFTPTSGGYYTIASQDIVNAGVNSCIEPSGGSTASGAQIVIYTCTNTNAEQWALLPVVATPTFSPGAGAYTSAQTVTISDSTPGATIYYTTNGTTPTTASAVYSNPITVASSEMLEAIATASGYSQSAVATASYGIGALPVSGLYTIQNMASDLVLDGGGSGTTKGTWVVQDANSGGTNQQWIVTSLGSGTFQILGNADGLSLDDYGDNTANGSEIDVWTINGSSGQIWYLTPASSGYYTVASQDIVNAGVDSCIEPSGGSTASGAQIVIYTCTSTSAEQWAFVLIKPSAATPTFSPAAGTYTAAQTVTISDSSSGATIYYTTDGTTPTTSSAVYSGPIVISCCTSVTINAIAGGTNYWPSPVSSAAYTITLPAAAMPSFSPGAGTYSSAQMVTIRDGTSGATIYYTTNGTTPTTSSAQYTGAIDVSASERVEAIATASGYTQSAVGAAYYTIGSSNPSACSGMTLGTSVAGTADLNGFIPFQSATGMTSLWNTNIVNAPLDPNNATITSAGGFAGLSTHVNFGSSPGDGGIPFIVVDSSQTPSVPINVIDYAGQSDVVVAPYPAGDTVPIEGAPADCSGWPDTYQGDAHTLVVDRNKCWVYETFNTNHCNGLYNASGETIWDMANGEMRPWGWTSADAAGLSIFAGLVRYDEAASGHINHAIRFTMQQTKNDNNGGYFVEPASHAAGTLYGINNVEGMRVRLSPTFNISGYSAINQAILTALQQYGMILADNGGYFFIQGATDSRWNDSDLVNLAGIPSSNFSVIQMTPEFPGYDAVTAPTGAVPVIGSFTASATQVSSGTPVTFSYSVTGDSFDYIDMIGPVRLSSGSGSVTITPTATQTYTFYSTSAYGQAWATPITVVVTGSTVVPPTFTPPAGTYSAAQTVTLNSSTYPYATIYYTTDGSTPTYPPTGTTQEYPVTPTPPSSSGAVNSITVSASETVKAIAVAPGYSSPSAVSSAIYTIN
jgi:hypothetical protein